MTRNFAILVGSIAALLIGYWVQAWVYENTDLRIRYLFGAAILLLGAALTALIAERTVEGIPWWCTPIAMACGALMFFARAIEYW